MDIVIEWGFSSSDAYLAYTKWAGTQETYESWGPKKDPKSLRHSLRFSFPRDMETLYYCISAVESWDWTSAWIDKESRNVWEIKEMIHCQRLPVPYCEKGRIQNDLKCGICPKAVEVMGKMETAIAQA